jgi:RHS repeat-associated protein
MNTRLPLAQPLLFLLLFAANAYAGEGRTIGQFAVSRNGSAQYSIPIWAPPGPKALQPNIALAYNSQSGNGPMGVGWYLSGLSTIYRCNSTYAQDSSATAVALTYSDRFCLDGNRLRLTSSETLSTYGQSGTTYQTEIANFSNVTAQGTTGNGPTYFTVQSRDGLTYEYGNGGNSQVLLNGTAGTWLLDKVTDRAGNTMKIAYVAAGANLVGATEPATISWTPSTYGAATYNYTMQFTYSTTTTPSQSGYVAASAYLNATILTNIEISSAGAVVKNYVLGYTPSSTTARETLTSVKECADHGATNCLIPTAITYPAGTVGVASPTTSSGSGSATGGFYSLDINGDGRKDLIYSIFSSGTNTFHWYVQFASGTGYGAPVDTALVTGQTDPVLFDDFLGNGKIDLLAPQGGIWTMVSWNGSAFVATSTGLALDSNRQPSTTSDYATADVNGDGLPDLVAVLADTNIHTRLNTSNGTTLTFASTTTSNGTGGLTGSLRIAGNNQFPMSSVQHLDVNGDGRDDIVYEGNVNTNCHLVNGQIVCTPAPRFTVFYANGTGFTAGITANFGGSVNQFLPLHFNDDACTDFIMPGSNTIYIAGCDGGASTTIAAPANIVAALDWDGDGRTDILANPSGTLNVYKSQGTALSGGTAAGFAPPSGTLVVTDQNGDGLDDLAYANSASSYHLFYGLHNGPNTPPDLMSTITDGYGNSVSPAYASIANSNYTNLSDAITGYRNYIGPLYVVSRATFSDPSKASGGTFYQTSSYSGAWTSLQGRGFSGFEQVQRFDSRGTLWETLFYDVKFPYTSILDADYVSQDQARTKVASLSYVNRVSRTLDSTQNNQRYFVFFDDTTIQKWEVGGAEDTDPVSSASKDYTFDNYGNALTVDTTVTDNDPGSPYSGDTWTTSTTNTTDISVNQSVDLAAWCLNMLTGTQVIYSSTLAGSTSVTRTKAFTPDLPANCRIKTLVTEPTPTTNPYKVTEALTFDSFGNVQTDTVTGNNMPSSPATRLTTLNWGTTGQFLNTLTDPSNGTTTWTYTSNQSLTFGVPDSVKNANNVTTSWQYDVFGRKNKETRPDNTSTTWTWSACTSFCGWSNSVYQIAQTAYQTNGTTVIRTDTTAYDSIDRATQAAGPTVTGATATVQTLYNSLGLLAQRSMPFISGTPYLQTYAFDVLNRVISETRPISSTNSSPQSTGFAYAGRTLTVTDPNGHKKTTITDVNGWLRQAKDALGFYVTKAYDSAGSLIGVTDSAGNSLLKSVTYAYGIKPFRLAATDVDRGAWSYTVDSLGERTSWTDAKGQAFSMSYDALSRPLTRTEPDQFSQWTYGSTPASHNVGQLIAECTGTVGACSSSGYSESRTFDSLAGRPSTRAITEGGNAGNDPGGVFLFTSAYDSTTGFPKTLTYPISTSSFALTVQYVYQNGLLQSVTDTSDTVGTCGTTCTLWTANAMNAFGQLTQETLGNGVVMNRTYDAVTSWLSASTAGVGGGATLLNQSYSEDKVGNIIGRQQNNAPPATESFAYDADNRLTCAQLSSTCTTTTMVYDGGVAGPGNITSQTGVGTYTYPAAGQPRPHAVTSLTGTFNGIVNPTFSYDANGNMTSRASSIMTWFSNNYPAAIAASDVTGSEEVQFNYGPDRQRWKQIYTLTGSPTETTYYVGGLIDLVFVNSTTDYRQYIYAGGKPVAVYSRTAAGANTMRYMLEDHEGSASVIASNSGAANINESFSAFGQRRNPSTWSGAPSTGDLNTIAGLIRQGYTFQTALGQSMGLNHMNGRVEDAILGRFLSPDPHIPDPTNAQNYNRYSYVNNNPLTFTDPTGFCSTHGILAIMGSGGCSGGDDAAWLAGVIGTLGGSDGFDNLQSMGSPTSGQSTGSGQSSGSGSGTTGNSSGGGVSSTANTSAQSQNSTQSQSSAGSTAYDPNDATKDIVVTGNYMDADPGPPTFYGPNYALIGRNPQYAGYSRAMDVIAWGTLAEAGVVLAGGVAVAYPAITVSLPVGGSVPAACILCVAGLTTEGVGYALEMGETLTGKEIAVGAPNIASGLETALEAGQRALEIGWRYVTTIGGP